MSTASLSAARLRSILRVVVPVVLLGLITHSSNAGSGDEPHYLVIAHSIAFDFDFDVANNYGRNEPLIAGGGLDPEPHIRRGVGGTMRPIHDIGLPVLYAPAARLLVPLVRWTFAHAPAGMLRRAKLTPTVLYRHGISLFMIVLATILAGLVFDSLIDLGAYPRDAFAVTLLVVLSPPLLIYSVLFFTELLSALLCFYVFRELALDQRDLRVARLESGVGSGAEYWAPVGAAIGLLMLVHVRNAGLVIGLVLLALLKILRMRSYRDLGGFILGLGTMLLARTIVTHYFWGTLVTTPHGNLGTWTGVEASAREAVTRLAGLFLDQEYGLLIYAPVYALAIAGLAVTERPVVRAIAIVAGCYLALILCPVTNVHGWTGAWCPAGRFLVPILPILAIPLYAALRVFPKALFAVFVVAQIVINAYMWQNPKNLWNDGDGVAAICSRGGLSVCPYLPSFTGR
jgi:hypothetical protein